MSAILLDPFIMGMGSFVVFTILGCLGLIITTSRRWHDQHHQHRSELMCDHCVERKRQSWPNCPPMWVLGESRRRK